MSAPGPGRGLRVLGTQRGTLGHKERILRSPVLREMFRWPRAAQSLLNRAWLRRGSSQ